MARAELDALRQQKSSPFFANGNEDITSAYWLRDENSQYPVPERIPPSAEQVAPDPRYIRTHSQRSENLQKCPMIHNSELQRKRASRILEERITPIKPKIEADAETSKNEMKVSSAFRVVRIT